LDGRLESKTRASSREGPDPATGAAPKFLLHRGLLAQRRFRAAATEDRLGVALS
jgi:hypothetical protein